jgi:hypothetical protein
MAVVSAHAKLLIALATGSRQWDAVATVQDTAAGGSVIITTTRTDTGVTPPDVPDTLTLNLYDDAGTLLRAFTLTPASTSQTSTFFFTDTGATGGLARVGTVEIAVRATRTAGLAAANYDVETDGAPNTPPTGATTTLDRGWIRSTTTAVVAVSNVSAGGAKPSPFAYPDTIFHRLTLGAAGYLARQLTATVSGATPALTGTSNSTVGPVFDTTMSTVVDNRFPASSGAQTASVATPPNATLTGQPYTVLTTLTTDSLTVDPRLTASHHFQVDDNTFATAKNDTSKAMLSTSSGFLATRFVTARTIGVNGLTVNQTLTPVGPGTAVGPTASTTATRDTQDGWTDLLAWTSSKPGGTWNKTVAVTAPAPITGAAYVVGGADAYVLLAPDPRIGVMVGLGPTTASEDDHLHPGDTSTISVTVFSRDTGKRLAPDAGTVVARLFRWNRIPARFEYLAADGVTWTAWTGTTVVADTHTLTDAGDGVTFTRALGAVLGATTDLVAVQVAVRVGGTPYGFYIGRELTGTPNGHAGYGLDAAALALSGVLSFK